MRNWEIKSDVNIYSMLPYSLDCFISPKAIANTISLPSVYIDTKGNEYTKIDTDTPTQTLLQRKYTLIIYYDEGIPEISNPDSYTSVTETFTLNNPTKDGYIFLGWTGSNGDVPQTEVTIAKGTKGRLYFTANWQKVESDVSSTPKPSYVPIESDVPSIPKPSATSETTVASSSPKPSYAPVESNVPSTPKPSYAPMVSATNRPYPSVSSIPVIPRPSTEVSTTVSSSPGSTMKSASFGKSPELVEGKSITDGKTKAVYKITKVGSEVEYVKNSNKAASKVTIPATIKISEKTYKVVGVQDNAFNGCTKLKTVVIGKNVVKIGKRAFYGCKKLKKITVKTTKLKTVGSNAIKDIYKKAVIKVPKSTKKKYKKLFCSKTGFKNQMKIK